MTMGRGTRRDRHPASTTSDTPSTHPHRGRRLSAKTDGQLGARVRWARELLGLTREQVAAPTYVPTYVSRVEAGQVRPSHDALEHLAARLGFTAEELAFGLPDLALADALRRSILLIARSTPSPAQPTREAIEGEVTVAVLRSALDRVTRT